MNANAALYVAPMVFSTAVIWLGVVMIFIFFGLF
jgi:hypothetical protein